MSTGTFPSPYQGYPRAAEGWYTDPYMTNTVRYWDGVRWTGSVVTLPSASKTRGNTFLIVTGYISALLIPILGFIIGIVLLAKSRRSEQGIGIIVVSGLAFVLYLLHYLAVYSQF